MRPSIFRLAQTGIVEIRQVRQQTQVLGIEDIRPPFIFYDREILSWPLLFHDVVFEAAALDALRRGWSRGSG
jgi:hypothetical protein